MMIALWSYTTSVMRPEIGYDTVSYLRIIYNDGTISCSFVTGKSRNAPIRAPIIPRLELQSALLAVRMNRMIQRELDIFFKSTLKTEKFSKVVPSRGKVVVLPRANNCIFDNCR